MWRTVTVGIGIALGQLLFRCLSFLLGMFMWSSLGLVLAGHTALALGILGSGVVLQALVWTLIVRVR